MKNLNFALLALVGVAACTPCKDAREKSTFISGVNPELHTFNQDNECGTGAVVPWAESLWAVSYAPHRPEGSTDKLYQITPDFKRIIRSESIGGTPANRMIHKESNQLFIGPYAIDATGHVRVMKPINDDGSTNLYGRLTATARHLTDPANKVYMLTMEEGLYEIDVKTLAVKEIFRDANVKGYGDHGGELLPGYHGKGAYTVQGRLVYANNGEYTPTAMEDPTTTSGVLAQWNGKPGKENWQVVLRNQFTDVTSKGGITGAENPATDPLWSIGWDYRSVILMVLDGGIWHKYRLPKGSHSYDGAHGWNTEWPRIREIGMGDDYLMTMHGTFWRFPATMSAKNSAGIRPHSNYLKVIGDFCRWNDKIVFGCDDTAKNEFLNKRRAKGGLGAPGQSNSSLWFVNPSDLATFGPAIGRGAVWQEEDVKAGQASDPYLLDGFDNRQLQIAGDLAFDIEVDEKGNGAWKKVALASTGNVIDLKSLSGAWIRLVAKKDAKKVTAFFSYWNDDTRKPQKGTDVCSRGVVRSGYGNENLPLEMVLDNTLYLMRPGKDGTLELKKSDDTAARDAVKDGFGMDKAKNLGDTYDEASALITDDKGKRWRFPYATAARGRDGRLCREVCTERDLLNIGGTFYELPAENAGGYAKIRAVATHASAVYDYCTWRGLFAISGVDFSRVAGGCFVASDDGKAKLWVGVADDLWKLGKPMGCGGPWKNTAVKAGEPSDPFIMTGFDQKSVTVSASNGATITLEIDITGCGTWIPLKRYASAVENDDLGGIRAYWVRAVADKDCTVTVQFSYR